MQTPCVWLPTCLSILTPPHTHPFNGPLSGTTWVIRYHKGQIDLDFTEARDSEWRWHQLGHMQVCTSLQTDDHASTPPLSLLPAGCPFCRQTNSVKALKAKCNMTMLKIRHKNYTAADTLCMVANLLRHTNPSAHLFTSLLLRQGAKNASYASG